MARPSNASNAQAYLPSAALPASLRQHCIIHIEEGLYTQALTLLLSLLTTSAPRLLLLPPPSLLALASTLSVHPAYTTRATAGPDARAAADSALNLLRHVVRLASPLDAEFASAFAFAEDGAGRDARRRRRGRRARDLEANVGADDEDEEQPRELVDVELAGPGSVFVKGEDWWRVFGWAMNCAARSAGRWARWGLWLDVMVDALERDWAERERVRGVLGESLIALYLGAAGADGRTGRRRIMRAVFANGDDRAMREFGEIWKNETKERLLDEVAQSWRGKRKRLDIDEGDFGDYARDEEGEEEVEVKGERQGLRSSARGSRPPAEELEEPDGEEEEEDHVDAISEESYGGWQAMAMRRRVLVLLMRVGTTHPASFGKCQDLINSYTEFLRPLPLPVFVALVSTAAHASNGFPTGEHSLLLRTTLGTLLSGSVPREVEDGLLTQQGMRDYYLPGTANTSGIVNNTKVALCAGYLMRLMLLDRGTPVEMTGELKRATKQGIKARRAKINAREATWRHRMGEGEIKEAEAWFESAEGMLKGMCG